MQHIFWGVVIISIGLFFGQSVFLSDFSPLSFVFDGLGLFWIGKGLMSLRKKKEIAQPSEPPSTAA